MIPRGTILAAIIAVAVGIGWVVWVKMEPAPAPDAPVVGEGAAAGGPLDVPSGQKITFLDRTEEPGETVRYRFVAPDLDEGNLADEASADMEALCNGYALGNLPSGAPPKHIVISLSSAEVPLGEARPDVTQVFDAFHIEDGKCVWEMF